MHYTDQTPISLLKKLIFTLAICNFASALLNLIFSRHFGSAYPVDLFALSLSGIQKGFFWQLFTYPFVSTQVGLSLGFCIEVLFEGYILWTVGSLLLQRISSLQSMLFALTCTIGTGMVAASLQISMDSPYLLASLLPLISACIIAWAMFSGEGMILLFFVIPIRIKTLTACYLGLITLINLSHENYLGLLVDLTSPLLAYLFALAVWQQRSPYPYLHSFETVILRLCQHFQSDDFDAKRYDFKTGKAQISDDEFVDKMLEKISRSGKESLTWAQRWRLWRIARRRGRRPS